MSAVTTTPSVTQGTIWTGLPQCSRSTSSATLAIATSAARSSIALRSRTVTESKWVSLSVEAQIRHHGFDVVVGEVLAHLLAELGRAGVGVVGAVFHDLLGDLRANARDRL